MTPEKSIKATRRHSPAGGSGNPRQRKLPCTLEAHVCAKVLNCTRTCTVTSSSALILSLVLSLILAGQ